MLDELTQRIVEFRDARDWKQFHSARNLATSISIESGELLELFQWSSDETLAADVEARRADLERELADVVIYALLLAHETGVDLEAAIEAKLAENDSKYPVDVVQVELARSHEQVVDVGTWYCRPAQQVRVHVPRRAVLGDVLGHHAVPGEVHEHVDRHNRLPVPGPPRTIITCFSSV